MPPIAKIATFTGTLTKIRSAHGAAPLARPITAWRAQNLAQNLQKSGGNYAARYFQIGVECLAISVILDQQKVLFPARKYQLIATDISERTLKRAKEGRYTSAEVQRGLTQALMERCFEPRVNPSNQMTEHSVKHVLKEQLSFRSLNLLESWPESFGPFDIIFCRKVLIYQSVENKRKVIAKIAKLLNPGGVLFLGAAESLIGLSESFKLNRVEKACYYQLM